MSLEHPGPGYKIRFQADSLVSLSAYMAGFNAAEFSHNISDSDSDVKRFLEWLKKEGHFPPNGWWDKIIKEYGDGDPAYTRFTELLHEFLELTTPEWFVKFNSKPQPSTIVNMRGQPRSNDIRLDKHIRYSQNT